MDSILVANEDSSLVPWNRSDDRIVAGHPTVSRGTGGISRGGSGIGSFNRADVNSRFLSLSMLCNGRIQWLTAGGHQVLKLFVHVLDPFPMLWTGA